MRYSVLYLFSIAVFLTVPMSLPAAVDDAKNAVAEIDKLAASGGRITAYMNDFITEQVELNPRGVAKLLLPKIKDRSLKDRQLAIYVWALGLTKDPTAVEPVIALHRQSKIALLSDNCLQALASIGGKSAGDYLFSLLNAESNKETQCDLLSLLAQMKYEAALPKAAEIFSQDPKQYFRKSIFVFGKMGDKAVPFLLEKIEGKDEMGIIAINVLCRWLIAPEAAEPLQKRFWNEEEAGVRAVILSALENVFTDFTQMQKFYEQVVAQEKDEDVKKYASDSIANIETMKSDLDNYVKKKQVSAEAFQKEYNKLFLSAGKKGSYDTLAAASAPEDEPKLKALRERILQRDVDSALGDCRKVNNIILKNRFLKNMPPQPAAP